MNTCGRFRMRSLGRRGVSLHQTDRSDPTNPPPVLASPSGGATMKETEPIADVELPSPGGFFEKLAEKLGASAQAAHIFGEPVERDGVTVIPVATARWGLGGGGGKRGGARRPGRGGGGGGGGGPPRGVPES